MTPNTLSGLSALIGKITDATNFYKKDNEYTGLCNMLRQIETTMQVYLFIEHQAKSNIDWNNTIPIMSKVYAELHKTQIVNELHTWRYTHNNDASHLPKLVELATDFYLFISRVATFHVI